MITEDCLAIIGKNALRLSDFSGVFISLLMSTELNKLTSTKVYSNSKNINSLMMTIVFQHWY